MEDQNKEEHIEDAHGNHAHGHGEPDVIVWHQEKLLPTMLMATVLVVMTLFGLSAAGHTKLDMSLGKAAFDKVESEKPAKPGRAIQPALQPNQGQEKHKKKIEPRKIEAEVKGADH
jgi:hypothetical protein